MKPGKEKAGNTGLRSSGAAILERLKRRREQIRLALRQWRSRLPTPVKRAIRRTTRWSLHSMNGVLLAIVLLFVLAHFWLPTLADRKSDIEAMLTGALGNPVRIGRLDTYWEGLNPGVRIQGFQVGVAGRAETVFQLRELRLSLLWRPLLTGSVAINSLVVVEPSLVVERDARGQIRITGVEMPATTDTPPPDIGRWLMQQREMVVENGILEWIDHQPADAPVERLTIQRVNLVLKNDGNRHQFEGKAAFPRSVCGDCRFTADIRGDLTKSADWSGDVSLQASELSLDALPRVFRNRWPDGVRGQVNARLESRWQDGWPNSVKGRVTVRDLQLPWPRQAKPVTVRSVDAVLDWRGDREHGHMKFSQLSLGLTRPVWLSGRGSIAYAPTETEIEVEHLNVGDVADFLVGLEQEGVVHDWLRAAKPEGSLDRLQLSLEGPITELRDYKLTTTIRGLRFDAHQQIPGISNLGGKLRVSRREGTFDLDAKTSRLRLPRLFRDSIDLQRLESRIAWRLEPEHWLVRASDIRADSRDGRASGTVELRVPFDPEQSPVIKLEAGLTDGVIASAPRYMPKAMPEALRRYLERALVSGRVTRGKVRLQGALRNFPFRDGKGVFEVTARVTNGVLSYMPDWEPIRDIDADLRFTGIGMEITGTQGTLGGLQVGRVTVAIEDFKAPEGAVVTATGRLRGLVGDALAVLESSKSPRFTPYLVNGLRTTGDGVLTLDLRIPARRPTAVQITGDYQLLGGSVEFPFRSIRAENVRGRLGFSEAGLQTGRLQARLLGSELTVEATPGDEKDPATRVDLSGTVAQEGINQVFGSVIGERLRGTIPWKARWWMRRDRAEWEVISDLRELEIRILAPLAKTQGESLGLTVRSLPATEANQQIIDLQLDSRVTGRLALQRDTGRWRLQRGHIGIGERISALPDTDGLQLSARLPSLNADNWWNFLRQLQNAENGSTGWFDDITRLRAEVDALELFSRPFGRMLLDFRKQAGKWQGTLQGDAVAGQMVYLPTGCKSLGECLVSPARTERRSDPRPAIGLVLDHLVLPPPLKRDATGSADPRSLPVLSVQSANLTFAGMPLGSLDFQAEPVRQGWQIRQAVLKTPETRLDAKGLWEVDWQGQQNTNFDISVTSNDFGMTLDQIGYPGELAKGRLSINSKWSWPGSPGDWSLSTVDGQMDVTLNDGRLLQISPGAGRILGVLDLRSLTRYLSLDMSNIFGKGLSFDSVKGRVEVENGNAYTRQLKVDGPGADIEMTGRVGLVTRDIELEMGVTPRLMEELAIGGAILGGPAVGAAVALLHNLARKPFEQGTRINYTVKGSWEHPDVKRIGGPDLPLEEPTP